MAAGEHNHVIVRGLNEVRDACKAIAGGKLGKRLTFGLRAAARPTVAAAAASAPVDDGDLAGSVGLRFNRMGLAIGSPLIQAPIVHFGRKAVVSGGKVAAHVRTLTPQRWLIPVVEADAPRLEQDAGEVMQSVLDELFDGIGA